LEQKRALLLFQLSFAIGIAVLLFALFWWQKKKQRDELRLREEEQKRLASELEHKNDELSLFTVNFIQKQQMVDELESLMKEARQEKVDFKLQKKLQDIERIVTSAKRSDKEWEDFKLYFEKVHKGFFDRLQKDYLDLTITELRLAALIKMNLSIKETASILGIGNDSVKTARHRLRTKLSLPREQNLANFLSSY